jgi:hypothetical protein
VLVTVDNGIASVDGVRAARALGLQVLVTDHHLPAVVDGAAGAAGPTAPSSTPTSPAAASRASPSPASA